MKQRVILESYDFGELCVNHAQTTPTFTNDRTQFLNSLWLTIMKMLESYHFFYNSPFSRLWQSRELCQFLKNIAHFGNYFYFFCSVGLHFTLT